MDTFLLYLGKCALALAVFLGAYFLTLGRETLYSLRRILLSVFAVLSFILPLCVITVHRTVLVEGTAIGSFEELSSPPGTSAGSTPWTSILLGIYILGAGATAFRIAASVLSVISLKRHATILPSDSDSTRIALVKENISPCSWMGTIFLSEEDFKGCDPLILEHEKAHLSRGHSWYVLLCDMLVCLQWFNPAAWLLRREMSEVMEYEADGAVLGSCPSGKQYQYALLAQSCIHGGLLRELSFCTNGFSSQGTVKRRIAMMKRRPSSPKAGYKALIVVPLIAAGVGLNARTVTSYVQEDESKAPSSLSIWGTGDPLVIVGEKRMTLAEFNERYSSDDISSISVYKDRESLLLFGPEAEDGAIVITLKNDVPQAKTGGPIKGKVMDGSGKPIPDAAVMVTGKNIGVLSGKDGSFSIQYQGSGNTSLTISHIGYESSTAPAAPDMTIILKERTQALDESTIIVKRVETEQQAKQAVIVDGNGDVPRIVVDGEEITYEELKKLDPKTIESIEVAKSDEDSPSGTVIVKLKKTDTK